MIFITLPSSEAARVFVSLSLLTLFNRTKILRGRDKGVDTDLARNPAQILEMGHGYIIIKQCSTFNVLTSSDISIASSAGTSQHVLSIDFIMHRTENGFTILSTALVTIQCVVTMR